MAQRLLVDRDAWSPILSSCSLGCRSAPGPLVPAAAQPVSRSRSPSGWPPRCPAEHRLHRFKWLFQDEQSSAGGRGSARIAPPDSLRFDVAGPFGSGAASAAVVGEQPLWAEPPDAIKKLVPNYPLMWAMFGVARLPADGVSLRGLTEGSVTAWQYAGRHRHGRVRADRRSAGQAGRRGPPCRRGDRTRRDDARQHRRAAQLAAHGAQRAGAARPHVFLHHAGRLCA